MYYEPTHIVLQENEQRLRGKSACVCMSCTAQPLMRVDCKTAVSNLTCLHTQNTLSSRSAWLASEALAAGKTHLKQSPEGLFIVSPLPSGW